MTRGVWKGPFVHPSLLKKIDKLKDQSKKAPIKTWSRNSTIIPEFVGHSFLIHNGKSFIPITVSEEMVGHKLGEFSPTRKFSGHTPADKKAAAEGSAPKAAPVASPDVKLIAVPPLVMPPVVLNSNVTAAPPVLKSTVSNSPSAGADVKSILPAEAYTEPVEFKIFAVAPPEGGSMAKSHWLLPALDQTIAILWETPSES